MARTVPLDTVELANGDLRAAAAVMNKPRGLIRALDVRILNGGLLAHEAGPAVFDAYCGAIDKGLADWPGLTTRGYELRRKDAP